MMVHFRQFLEKKYWWGYYGWQNTMWDWNSEKFEKVFGNLWDILISIWKSSDIVKSSSEIILLPKQKYHAKKSWQVYNYQLVFDIKRLPFSLTCLFFVPTIPKKIP